MASSEDCNQVPEVPNVVVIQTIGLKTSEPICSKMTLPSHLISPAERSEALPHWRCPNVDTKETPLRDVLSHSTLSETSKDSAPHHFCHILLSPMWAPLLCKATKCHNQLASGQMITKASTCLPQATADVNVLGHGSPRDFLTSDPHAKQSHSRMLSTLRNNHSICHHVPVILSCVLWKDAIWPLFFSETPFPFRKH